MDTNNKLTPKQRIFCLEYVIDLNATRAAIKAGYSKDTASQIGSRLLRNVKVRKVISELQGDLEKTSGITKLKLLNALSAIAFSNVQGYPRVIKRNMGTKEVPNMVDIEPVVIRTFDKIAALAKITEMLGHNLPTKIDLNIDKLTDDQVNELFERVINKLSN